MIISAETKKKRRPDSAAAGGVFLSLRDLSERWGCEPRTAAKRCKSIPKYRFSATVVRYSLSDIRVLEEQMRDK